MTVNWVNCLSSIKYFPSAIVETRYQYLKVNITSYQVMVLIFLSRFFYNRMKFPVAAHLKTCMLVYFVINLLVKLKFLVVILKLKP